MRIVSVFPYRIVPPDNGGRALLFGASRELSRQAERFQAYALCSLKEGRRSVAPPPFDYREIPVASSLLMGPRALPFMAHVPYLCALRLHVRSLARRITAAQPDVVEVCQPWLGGLRASLPRATKVVVVTLNVEAIWYEDSIRNTLFPAWVARWLARLERDGLRQADHVLCLTDLDREELVRRYDLAGERASVIPPGEDFASPGPTAPPSDPRRRRRAVFFGSRFWSNRTAAWGLIRDVAPACPEVDFVLAGSVCQALGQSPRPPNVALLGHQENLDALLDSCDLLVSPMDMRTGINVKVLRALARGLRVVTTPSGARGYDGLVGGPIRVAPLPGFAPLVRAAQRLSAAEWSGIAGAYGWPAVIARRLALYERLRAPGGPFPRG